MQSEVKIIHIIVQNNTYQDGQNNNMSIISDQSIPRGLHIRLNLQTGEREAKLMDDSEHTELTHVSTSEELNRDELQDALKNVPGDEGITPEVRHHICIF